MSLQNLQAEVSEAILTNDQRLLAVNPAANISIYHNNVHTNLINTLRDIYPLIVKLVGDDFFQITAREYIKQYPSRSGNLHEYGEYFTNFVSEFQPLKDLNYLAEVAQFEWACHTICFATEHAAMDMKLLGAIAPDAYDQLYFTLNPACQVIHFYYPILRIIDLCKNKVDGSIDLGETGVDLLIFRRNLDIQLIPLSAGEFALLSALQDNTPLSEALDDALHADPEFKLDEKLPQWVQDKIIVDCRVNV